MFLKKLHLVKEVKGKLLGGDPPNNFFPLLTGSKTLPQASEFTKRIGGG